MILPQFFLEFGELKTATNCTIKHSYTVLTEIIEAILLSIEGYCVCRDRYAVFRKLSHSRKLYLCMNSASRIFFSASFLSVYEVVRTTKKKFAWLACLHRTPTSNTKCLEWSKKLCELSGNKRLTKNSAGNKFFIRKVALYDNLTKPLLVA